MTSPSPPRPGHARSDLPHEPALDRSGDDAPADAVTLADLIAESGPLPADAALECVQRLAERLTLTPHVSCAALGPADVLIDDDGGVWLNSTADGLPNGPANLPPQGMDRLGRLLAFLATGDGYHLVDGSAAAELPAPLSTVAGRLFSNNGACYRSYAELAGDAAVLRGVAPAATAVVEPAPEAIEVAEPKTEAVADSVPVAPVDAPPALSQESSSGGLLGIGMIVAAAVGAAAAYLIWQAL